MSSSKTSEESENGEEDGEIENGEQTDKRNNTNTRIRKKGDENIFDQDLDSLNDILKEGSGEGGSMGIVCHDNPDPDCIASGLALKNIAESKGINKIDLIYSGEISHQQNRAFVNLLGVEMVRSNETDLEDYNLIAFVDHSVKGANNRVPQEIDVDIVIDHHPSDEEIDARYVDIREEYGATTTMLVEYIREYDLEPDSDLATALLFAIRTETLEFIRDVTKSEYEAAKFLHPISDIQLLKRMTKPAYTPATLDSIGQAIVNREVRASALISGVGRSSERDALPQAADQLMNLEGISTVLVFGIVNGEIQISSRSDDSRINLDQIMREAFGDVGSAGGHQDMAGAQIPLGIFSEMAENEEKLVGLVSDIIKKRFFDAMNLSVEEEETENGEGNIE